MKERFMDFITVKEKERILNIIRYLISKRVEVSINIKGRKEQFTTKAVKVKRGNKHNHLIIEKLYPEAGDSLIQSSPDVLFSFEASERKCIFATKYLGINTQPPEFGLIVDFPATIQIEEKRREERVENGLMKFFSAEFILEEDKKLYQLNVINLGPHGIGLIVNRENYVLLDKINVGDTIKNLKFFLEVATLTIDGKVRHKTQIKQGKLKGSYILGIKSDFIMNLKELEDKLKKKS